LAKGPFTARDKSLMAKTLLVTGSSGEVPAEEGVSFVREMACAVGNRRPPLPFGHTACARWNRERLRRELSGYNRHEPDIRYRPGGPALVRDVRPEFLAHPAAQLSRDPACRFVGAKLDRAPIEASPGRAISGCKGFLPSGNDLLHR
jgi:hypothetical protein